MASREASVIYSDLPLFAGRCVASLLQEPDAYAPPTGTLANGTCPFLGNAGVFSDDFARAVGVPDYDVCSVRSGDQGGSSTANAVAAPTKQQQRDAVCEAVLRAGRRGVTLRELAAMWGVPMHTISGRFSELRDMGLISRLLDAYGRTVLRDGCGVWVAVGGAR